MFNLANLSEFSGYLHITYISFIIFDTEKLIECFSYVRHCLTRFLRLIITINTYNFTGQAKPHKIVEL